tara:strand:+ start:573 stop:1232 length:660 start_codon:yes stop_codon:yes gene_type:complete
MSVNNFGYSVKEELANTITHTFGFFLSLIGSVIVIIESVNLYLYGNKDLIYIISAVIFSLSLLLMYASSSFYHGIKNNQIKSLLQKLDHCAIFLLIAGSYTPFTLITLGNHGGVSLFIFIWSLTAVGILLESFPFKNSFAISIVLYFLMGWSVLAYFEILYSLININGLILLISGGLFYTFGIIFFAWKRIPYNHAIWHVFVLAGSISHYFSILYYVIE